MKISSQIAWEFDRGFVRRGYYLFQDGHVELEFISDRAARARIGGFRVNLVLTGSTLEAKCNCSAFNRHLQCEHVWATLLEVDGQDGLKPPAEGRVTLMPARSSSKPARGRSFAMAAPEPPAPPPPVPKKLWLNRTNALIDAASPSPGSQASSSRDKWPANRLIFYGIHLESRTTADLRLSVFYADPRKKGAGLTKPHPMSLTYRELGLIPDENDRSILRTLVGAREGNSYYSLPTSMSSWTLYPELAHEIVPRLCATCRCVLVLNTEAAREADQQRLRWEPEPWHFSLVIERDSTQHYVSGVFTRGGQKMGVSDPLMIAAGRLLFTDTAVAPIVTDANPELLNNLRIHGPVAAPHEEWEDLASTLVQADLPASILPPELQVEEQRVDVIPCLQVETRKHYFGSEDVGIISFDYEGTVVAGDDRRRRGILQPDRKLLVRNLAAEQQARERLQALKLQQSHYDPAGPSGWVIPPDRLGHIVSVLTREGWRVTFKGKQVVQPSGTHLDVTSGIDWFDLHASVSFGEHKYTYPQLLKALEEGGPTVILPNGDLGVLPDQWIAEIGRLTSLGKREGNAIRFKVNQAGLLDVLLADRPEVRFDETFTRARDRLKAFEGIRAVEQPAGFSGKLRDYQREGVGWMEFLRDFGFGGCLADDMGVGKTAQVLALLETRRQLRQQDGDAVGPSIAIVPRSLVFNWKQEAARFTPGLRILDHTTPDRSFAQLRDYDLIIVTYGTLRRDIPKLREIKFDYAILDEAQAIKNPISDSAKAARLLDARHRLALSGTPVQNSLSDLWSLFQFLNPGMLGASNAFKSAGGSSKAPEEQTRTLIARALRPLILRRTKEQVASELPPKTESIIHCVMEGDQRRLYDELREHYRQSLLGAIDAEGMAKAKIMVLEALLRLRQAACHPGLIDKKRVEEPSAKLDTLLARLSEVVGEGHKALVFSQFTSFLDIVRTRLDKDGITYEYLDGATRNRQQRVENFEKDPHTRLFLVSLKAGGVGLNLVAADYVFLLDPWWNPAVEAQAIDRTHRIGQTRHVFAYRLIAQDTVEEKVLSLQDSKRHLAEAVINQDNSVLARMGREELEYLLS